MLVAKHKNWRFLLRDLLTKKEFYPFGGVAKNRLIASLLAPVAVARFIAEKKTELAKKERLRLLIIGPEIFECSDDGRAFGFIPYLLNAENRMSVEAVLVGPEIPEMPKALPAMDIFPAAQMHHETLESFLQNHSAQDFDLAVALQPGFEQHQGLLQDGGLVSLIEAGVPIMAASFAYDEFLMDTRMAKAFGFPLVTEFAENPFFIDDSESPVPGMFRWGSILWEFPDTPPPADWEVDEQLVAKVQVLSEIGGRIGASGISFSPGKTGRLVDAPGYERVIYIDGHHYVDPRDMRLLEIAPSQVTAYGSEGEATRDWPGEEAEDFELLVWAARIWRHEILPCVDDEEDSFFDQFVRAIEDGNLDAAKNIVLNNPGVAAQADDDGWTLYHYAAAHDCAEMISWLKKNTSIDINRQDDENWTALVEACSAGHIAAASALLECGADPDIPTAFGHTAFSTAQLRGNTELKKMLEIKTS